MTEQNAQSPVAPKPARKKRTASTKPRAPRVVDPEIAKIKAETAAKVAEYRKGLKSGAVLKYIIENQVPKLTFDDQANLCDVLRRMVTPALLPPATPDGAKPIAQTEAA